MDTEKRITVYDVAIYGAEVYAEIMKQDPDAICISDYTNRCIDMLDAVIDIISRYWTDGDRGKAYALITVGADGKKLS